VFTKEKREREREEERERERERVCESVAVGVSKINKLEGGDQADVGDKLTTRLTAADCAETRKREVRVQYLDYQYVACC